MPPVQSPMMKWKSHLFLSKEWPLREGNGGLGPPTERIRAVHCGTWSGSVCGKLSTGHLLSHLYSYSVVNLYSLSSIIHRIFSSHHRCTAAMILLSEEAVGWEVAGYFKVTEPTILSLTALCYRFILNVNLIQNKRWVVKSLLSPVSTLFPTT